MHGVCVVPAHVLLIDGLGVVGHGSVILAGVPNLLQSLRQFDHIRDLIGGVSLVDIGQSLVIDEFIDGGGVD